MLTVTIAVLAPGFPDLLQMLLPNPASASVPRGSSRRRCAHPTHRIFVPHSFLNQILTHEPHLAGPHFRHRCLRVKPCPAADIVNEHLPIHFLQVSAPVAAASANSPNDPVRVAIRLQWPRSAPVTRTASSISVHHYIPSLRLHFPFELAHASAWAKRPTSAFCDTI